MDECLEYLQLTEQVEIITSFHYGRDIHMVLINLQNYSNRWLDSGYNQSLTVKSCCRLTRIDANDYRILK